MLCLALGASTTVRAGEALDTAQSVAGWLAAVERRDIASGGSWWPQSDRNEFAQVGLDAGAAGIGLFHLRLWQATGREDALSRARRAGDYTFAQYRAGRLNGPDWLGGAAGGGSFFLDMFSATGDPEYLRRAEATADALIASAIGDAQAGWHWEHGPGFGLYTGRAHGTAGIGLFLLRLYDRTGVPAYLTYAEGAYRWMRVYQLPLGDGAVGWKRLATDGRAYHLWCGGSAGIITFLAELHRVTGGEEYRTALRATADGLVRSAQARGPGLAWNYYSSGDHAFPVVYCHGASSVATALYAAHAALGEPRYLEAARAAWRWMLSIAQRRPSGSMLWETSEGSGRFDTGYFVGSASVGRGLLEAFAIEHDPALLDASRAVALGLREVADVPGPGQMRFPAYIGPPRPDDTRSFLTGMYDGAAGIGLFFLALHEAETGAAR